MNHSSTTKYLLLAGILLLPEVLSAQSNNPTNHLQHNPIIPRRQSFLLSNVKVLFNTRVAFASDFSDGSYEKSQFSNKDFRLEIMGKIHDQVSFRLRNRYFSKQYTSGLDNLSHDIDMAYITIDVTPTWKVSIGKCYVDLGGYEMDPNPIDILKYSSMLDNWPEPFHTGLGISHDISPQHNLSLQFMNSNNKPFEKLYKIAPNGVIRKSKFPFMALVNWRAKFLEDKLTSVCSYSVHQEARGKYMHTMFLGAKIGLPHQMLLTYDFKLSLQALDNLFIISNMLKTGIPGKDGTVISNVSNTCYMGHWVRVDKKLNTMVNLFLVGAYDQARIRENSNLNGGPYAIGATAIQTHWMYIPGVELHPFKDFDLKVFGAVIGNVYKYLDAPHKAHLFKDLKDTHSLSITVGIISPLWVL